MPPAHPRQKKHSRKSRPDTVDKLLEAYPDVFADIINVLLYNGNPVVNPQFLTDGPSAAYTKQPTAFSVRKTVIWLCMIHPARLSAFSTDWKIRQNQVLSCLHESWDMTLLPTIIISA